MNPVTLHPTRCAICNTEGNATELYPPNFDFDAFNPEIFSARRLPDRVHYRMVKCNACGLVRSDPAADPQTLARLYAKSSFDYSSELDGLRRTYGRYLAKLESFGVKKDALLEIGCGNGFFLETALAQGYRRVQGVEPGAEAVAQAGSRLRGHILCEMMRPGLFPAEQFDVICLFQVFDHISDPAALLRECLCVLKPGGMILILNHNIEALSARLLGERSPIIDIEHTYLYSPRTLAQLCKKHGFAIRLTGPVTNTYRLHYLARLLPLSRALKTALLVLLQHMPLDRLTVSLPLGNMFLIAQKNI